MAGFMIALSVPGGARADDVFPGPYTSTVSSSECQAAPGWCASGAKAPQGSEQMYLGFYFGNSAVSVGHAHGASAVILEYQLNSSVERLRVSSVVDYGARWVRGAAVPGLGDGVFHAGLTISEAGCSCPSVSDIRTLADERTNPDPTALETAHYGSVTLSQTLGSCGAQIPTGTIRIAVGIDGNVGTTTGLVVQGLQAGASADVSYISVSPAPC